MAHATATSVDPTPVANAPSAPYVVVCGESPPMITSPGPTRPFCGEHAMFDAGTANLGTRWLPVEGELANSLHQVSGRDVLVRREMVGDEDGCFGSLLRVGALDLFELVDRQRGGQLVGKVHVDLHHEDLARPHDTSRPA